MKLWMQILITGSCLAVTSSSFAIATCPAPDSKTIVKVGNNYKSHMIGDPKIHLMTDHERKGPPKKFETMILSTESPYFISCAYDVGDFVLKTLKHHFFETNKNCTLKGAKPGDVQVTSIGAICKSHDVVNCQLVCK